jgi:aryl-alcohol dehydrogenase-like predicted oxidoreductase
VHSYPRVYRPPTLLLTLGAHRAVPPRLAAAWLLGCLAPWLLLAAAAAGDLIIIVGPHGTATATTDGVLAGGYLTDRYLGQPPPRRRPGTASLGKYLQTIEQAGGWGQLQRVLRACRLVADRHPGVSIANVATRWVLDQDAVAGERGHGSIVDAAPMLAEIYLRHACSYHEILRVKTQPAKRHPGVIVGARLGKPNAVHTQENLQALGLELDAADLATLDEAISRGQMLPGDCGDEYRD